jgi:hypothetical protein
MNTKLQMNIQQGVLDVEGSEDFVSKIYADFKETFYSFKGQPYEPTTDISYNEPSSSAPMLVGNDDSMKSYKKSKVKSGGGSPKIAPLEVDRDFINGSSGKRFLSEVKSFSLPKSHSKKITLFVYLMQKLSIPNISINKIFSCYRLLSLTTPNYLKQIITNTKNDNVWLIIDSWDDIKTHHKGDEMVEHELMSSKLEEVA